MFTGIVEEIGTVRDVETSGDSVRMTISAQRVLEGTSLGDSISVSGCCLTVADLESGEFTVDVMGETLSRVAPLHDGSRVNLERAMALGDRFGGHVVQGHVDAVAELVSRTPSERWDVLRFTLPEQLGRYFVEKGSITVSGTSLTVSALGDDFFEVSLIPTTLKETILGDLQVGEQVNIEVDVLAKYVEKLVG